jgi:hypothetical protein
MASAAAVYLNDAAQSRFTNTILLPYLKLAYLDLLQRMLDDDVVQLREVSGSYTVTALAQTITSPPTDMVSPLEVKERASASDDWIPIEELEWEPDDSAATHSYLQYYTWREGEIKFRGANRSMLVYIKYLKTLTDLSTASSIIEVANSRQFLIARTAARAAGYGGGSPNRAREIWGESNSALEQLSAIQIKQSQLSHRPRPYRYSKRIQGL